MYRAAHFSAVSSAAAFEGVLRENDQYIACLLLNIRTRVLNLLLLVEMLGHATAGRKKCDLIAVIE